MSAIASTKSALRCPMKSRGHYLALVRTFYAVLLGLVVFDAMSKFQDADSSGDEIIDVGNDRNKSISYFIVWLSISWRHEGVG